MTVSWLLLLTRLLRQLVFHVCASMIPKRFYPFLSGAAARAETDDGTSREPDVTMTDSIRLLDLPDELLVLVVGLLDPLTLCRVSCVSRHLHALSEPFIYENFDILHSGTARRLAQCVSRDQRRATWLKTLSVSTRFGDDRGLEYLPLMLPLMRNVRTLRLETPDCNLKKPQDRVDWVDLQREYENVFARSTLAVPRQDRLLPNLRSCTLHFVDDRSELYSLTKYANIFLHPTLKSLTLSCASTDHPDRLLTPYQHDPRYRRATGLETLELEECDVLAESLAVLLRFPKSLRSLKLSEGTRYDNFLAGRPSRMHGNMAPNALSLVLAQTCSSSLESLSLSLGHRRSRHASINQIGHHLNLTALHRLRHLEVSMSTVSLVVPQQACDHALYQRLPPRLESFKVFGIPLSARTSFSQTAPGPTSPMRDCVIRDKARHGLGDLQHVTWSYEHYRDEAEDEQTRRINNLLDLLARGRTASATSRHNASAKKHLVDFCNQRLSSYRDNGVRMTIEIMELPPGFIPPYLCQEDKPQSSVLWDSDGLPADEAVADAVVGRDSVVASPGSPGSPGSTGSTGSTGSGDSPAGSVNSSPTAVEVIPDPGMLGLGVDVQDLEDELPFELPPQTQAMLQYLFQPAPVQP